MADLIALSSKIIDAGYDDGSAGPLNRINHELSVLDDNIAMVEAFSHAVCFRTDAGLAVFDTSGAQGVFSAASIVLFLAAVMIFVGVRPRSVIATA